MRQLGENTLPPAPPSPSRRAHNPSVRGSPKEGGELGGSCSHTCRMAAVLHPAKMARVQAVQRDAAGRTATFVARAVAALLLVCTAGTKGTLFARPKGK